MYDTGWQNVTGLNRTLQMCTVKIDSGLGYKSSQVRVQVQVQQKNGLKSGLESYSLLVVIGSPHNNCILKRQITVVIRKIWFMHTLTAILTGHVIRCT